MADNNDTMVGSVSADAPVRKDFFKSIREAYDTARKAVVDFVEGEEKAIQDKLAQIKQLEAEIEDHKTRIDEANNHIKK